MDLDQLKEYLVSQKFKIARENKIWYAYKLSELPARPCECNSDNLGMQIVVIPSVLSLPNNETHRAVEIGLKGEFEGVWWNLEAYSLTFEEVPEKLFDIEQKLITAWNALRI